MPSSPMARRKTARGRVAPSSNTPARRCLRALPALVLSSFLGAACSVNAYTGAARELRPETLRTEPGWLVVDGVPLLRQRGEHDCGPAALAMVLGYWHPEVPAARFTSPPTVEQTSARELRNRAYALGLTAFVVEGTLEDIVFELRRKRPVIVGVAKPTVTGGVAHFEVVVGLHVASQRIATLDPGAGLRQNLLADFLREWIPTGRVLLVVLPRAPPAGAGRHSDARSGSRTRS